MTEPGKIVVFQFRPAERAASIACVCESIFATCNNVGGGQSLAAVKELELSYHNMGISYFIGAPLYGTSI